VFGPEGWPSWWGMVGVIDLAEAMLPHSASVRIIRAPSAEPDYSKFLTWPYQLMSASEIDEQRGTMKIRKQFERRRAAG